MAENKQHITREHTYGKILISEDVVAGVALQALSDIEGFAGMSLKSGTDLSELLKINRGKTIKISISADNRVCITCNVLVYYGSSILDVAAEIQKNICADVQSVTGATDVRVNVNICGIVRK